MKKSKEISEINNELFTSLENVEENLNIVRDQISEYYKKIKKEYSKILIEEKYELLNKIAEGEKIDINILKSKYLKPKELLNLNESLNKIENIDSEELLDRLEVNGIIYYYENKEKGKVYDTEYKEVGIYKNKSIILN
jgi:hypothetical protein